MKKYKMKINGENYEAKILSYKGYEAKVNVNGIDYYIEIDRDETMPTQQVIQTTKACVSPEKISSTRGAESGQILAPIPGIVIDVFKKEGDVVEAGEVILSLEAMKMESELIAPISGIIKKVEVAKGDSVLEGDLLVTIASEKTTEPAKISKSSSSISHQQNPTVQKSDGNVRAPIPGTVLDIKVKIGQAVNVNDIVVIIEAMKMESEISAGVAGVVKSIEVSKGQSVNEGDIIVKVEE